jgi:modulator of FtsH protease HflK
MPWSNQSGGGGWKGGGGGPWGPRPGGPGQQPDLEEILRRSQDRIRQAMPGGRMGGPLLGLIGVVLVALVGFFGFTSGSIPRSSASFCGSVNMSGNCHPA